VVDDSRVTSARDRLSLWFDRFGRAWETRDAEQAAALFSEDASYRESPFDAPLSGRAALRAYWSELPTARPGITFAYELLAATHDGGIAHWRGSYTRATDGVLVELDGILLVTLDEEVGCRAFREWSLRRERPTPVSLNMSRSRQI
jgi:ketosteroid isomerase-like protein